MALAYDPLVPALCALGWAALACLVPLFRVQWRQVAIWGLVAAGVPLLGWMTYVCGPGFGVMFLALGLSILVWPPLDLLRRRPRDPAPPGTH